MGYNSDIFRIKYCNLTGGQNYARRLECWGYIAILRDRPQTENDFFFEGWGVDSGSRLHIFWLFAMAGSPLQAGSGYAQAIQRRLRMASASTRHAPRNANVYLLKRIREVSLYAPLPCHT